jgi:CYTH domain-containing protein
MAKEIERKFLLASDAWRRHVSGTARMIQFYLAVDEARSIRVRIRDDGEALLTLKFGAGARERDEFEYPIPIEDARQMRVFAVGNVIEKTRFLVQHGDCLFEVDEFHGSLEGMVLAELETAADVPAAALPGWLGREVTGDPVYYNAALALSGRAAAR